MHKVVRLVQTNHTVNVVMIHIYILMPQRLPHARGIDAEAAIDDKLI